MICAHIPGILGHEGPRKLYLALTYFCFRPAAGLGSVIVCTHGHHLENCAESLLLPLITQYPRGPFKPWPGAHPTGPPDKGM